MNATLLCMRKHVGHVEGCPSCRLRATSDRYRAELANLQGLPTPEETVGEPARRPATVMPENAPIDGGSPRARLRAKAAATPELLSEDDWKQLLGRVERAAQEWERLKAAYVEAVRKHDAETVQEEAEVRAGLAIGKGPGTELKAMTAQMGVPACQTCKRYAARMDCWGVGGCRERRAEIIAHLEAQAGRLGWFRWVAAGVKAVAAGLPTTAAGLFDEALHRAEGTAVECAAAVSPT
jgi:hypothetical protein